jgi:hypothetical protein
MNAKHCTWCGTEVEAGSGFRLLERTGERGATFCRLEHIVPWAIKGAHWETGAPVEPSSLDAPAMCSACGAELAEASLLLVGHRGEHRIPDAFCSVDHLLDWAKRGGRWQSA